MMGIWRKIMDDFGQRKYINAEIPVGGDIEVNFMIYKPIAVLSHSERSDHYWCYLNREYAGEDNWYWINDSSIPILQEPRNIEMVVYKMVGPPKEYVGFLKK